MRYLSIFILSLFHVSVSFAQEMYEVDVDERNNSIVITNTANDMMENGNYEQAAKVLESIFKNDPTFHPAYIEYYKAIYGTQHDSSKLIEVLKQGLTIFEDDDELAYYLGNVYQSARRFNDAIDAYSDAIAFSKINGEDYPIVWGYHFNRGNCHLKTAQYEKAIKDYSYALELSPDNGDILTNRGTSYYQVKQKALACEDWTNALKFGADAAKKYVDLYCKTID
ncbi:tetratricopeptide repeat protein [Belliella sp. DSM 111904]|uniref:Tetratricopeptide repeat protein n=1 Tax=Belliella filtrata TaxID=2923435 RepID=A0ABS9UZ07_9BACT|nr:tetratricopeptide repeat protein [Belliella filtrata]MCH7409383.1 tetratricopeptide repeat protein [Belliella filtrata]